MWQYDVDSPFIRTILVSAGIREQVRLSGDRLFYKMWGAYTVLNQEIMTVADMLVKAFINHFGVSFTQIKTATSRVTFHVLYEICLDFEKLGPRPYILNRMEW